MRRMWKKSAVFFAAIYLASGLPVLSADPPSPYDSGNQFQPVVSSSSPSVGSTASPVGDPTSNFFDGSPLSSSVTEMKSMQPVLQAADRQWVTVLMQDLKASVMQTADVRQEISVASSEGNQERMNTLEVKAESAAPAEEIKKNIPKSSSFFLNGYSQLKKKMQGPDFETLLSGAREKKSESVETFESSPDGILSRELSAKALVRMRLEVTSAVVKANEEFSLSETHPFMGWLAMQGVTEESKKAFVEAEAQRKAMADTVKEAEKNGNRVFFIANGKIVPFFFNIPLFLKGDYQLYILDEASFAPQTLPQ